jgi:AcrR family transcriptional regulator
MAGVASRESYFETGFDVLADTGYAGLKLAEVCKRLGVTTGSFYHFFPNWAAYTSALVGHWAQDRTVRLVESARAQPDPRRRIDALVQQALALPHGAEAAIRVWSALDPEVYAVQRMVDQQRFDVMRDSAFEILGNQRQAEVFASWAVYALVGFEQATIRRDTLDLRWIADQLLEALDSGRFRTVPDA